MTILSITGTVTYVKSCVLIGMMGISWAMTTWIPFVLLSEYTIKRRRDDSASLIGLMNIFIVLPQFLSIALCSVIFSINLNIHYVFVVSAISSIIAAIYAFM
jgi:hypothetical protein